MKIQINSLEALERLIGGDTQLEFDIRQSVVEAFAKKHIKALATEPVLLKIGTALQRDLESEFVTIFADKNNYGRPAFKLTDKAKELIGNDFEKLYLKQISATIEERFEKMETLLKLEERINNAAKYIADGLADTMLERRIDILVEKRIKERLGLK